MSASRLGERVLTLGEQLEHRERVEEPLVLPDVHDHDLGSAVLRDHHGLSAPGHLTHQIFGSILELRDRTDVRGLHRPEYST